MNAIVKEAWADRRCPIIDGVLFADGRIVVHDVVAFETGHVIARPMLESTIDSYLAFNDDAWISLVRRANCTIDDSSQRVFVGEGSMGSDGFVALCDASGDLIWVLISQVSDPFVRVSYAAESDTIRAESSSRHHWLIPRDRPHQVTVVKG